MLDQLSRALRGVLVVSCLWAGDSLTRQNQLRGVASLFPEVVRKSTSAAVPLLSVDPELAVDLEIRRLSKHNFRSLTAQKSAHGSSRPQHEQAAVVTV